MKKVLVCGAGGFIGSYLVERLKEEGYWVRGVDLKYPEFSKTVADDFVIGDLREPGVCAAVINRDLDEIYQLAAEVGGAGYVFGGENDAEIVISSALINLNVAQECRAKNIPRLFFSSSACIYPKENQQNPTNPDCQEHTAYPANPDSDYGWFDRFIW